MSFSAVAAESCCWRWWSAAVRFLGWTADAAPSRFAFSAMVEEEAPKKEVARGKDGHISLGSGSDFFSNPMAAGPPGAIKSARSNPHSPSADAEAMEIAVAPAMPCPTCGLVLFLHARDAPDTHTAGHLYPIPRSTSLAMSMCVYVQGKRRSEAAGSVRRGQQSTGTLWISQVHFLGAVQ